MSLLTGKFAKVPPAILVLVLELLVAPQIFGQSTPNQVDPGNATGLQPYNTYGGVRENINLATGDLNLQLPLLTLPGRNGHNFSVGLIYDTKIWQLHGSYNIDTGNYDYWWDYDRSSLGWRGNWPGLLSTWQSITPDRGAGSVWCFTDFIAITSDGSKHPFFTATPTTVQGNREGCEFIPHTGNPTPEPSYNIHITDANDSSFLRLDTTNTSDIILHTKSGEQIHFTGGLVSSQAATKIEDTDGNLITASINGFTTTITDTLGRVVTSTYIPATNSTTITYKDSNGTTQTITEQNASQQLAPTFSLPSGASVPVPFNYSMLSSITMPNNLSYTFTYNAYGEITKITYPTGGYTRYDYQAKTAYHYAWHDLSSTAGDFREVQDKHVCKQATGSCSTEDQTSYTATVDGTKTNNQYMDVVSPLNDKTHYQFAYQTTTATYGFFAPRELSRQIYQGQSTLLRTIQTDYNSLDPNGTPTNSSLPIRTTTTLNDTNQVTKTESDYDTTTLLLPSATSAPIDNVTEERDFDYGSGAPGSLLRRTDFAWLKTNSVNGQDYTTTGIHILDRKASETVYDSTSNTCGGFSQPCAQATYEYDNYTGNILSSSAVQHDSAFSTSYTYRGNLTATQRWRSTDGTWLTARHNKFDDAGNILLTTDPAGNPTNFSYADSWGNASCTPSGGNAAAYLTKVTNALNQATSYTYNSCAGTKASMTDPNSQLTSYSYDKMNRLIETDFPNQGKTYHCYTDTGGTNCTQGGPPLQFVTTKKITSTLNLITTAKVDGIGNVTQTQLNSDPDGVVYTDTTYDALERKSTVSNPYRSTSDSTYGITTYNYDALSRVIKLIPPDGSSSSDNVTTTYSGNCATVMDEASKIRKNCSDSAGRLVQAFEPDSNNNLVNETDYQYDALNNLLTVNQKGNDPNSAHWRTRTFTYDSLSELTNATNPESGSVAYTYDNDGNVHTKADARSITITYSYDALNRLKQKSYTDSTPTVTNGYDGIAPSGCSPTLTSAYPVGRRTAMCDGAGWEAWSYNQTGYPVTDRRTTNGQTKDFTYVPNLDNSTYSIAYPTGRTFTYAPGGAGKPLSAVDQANSISYATSAHYAPPGELAAMQNGANLNLTHIYNKRLQPCWLYATTGTALSWNATLCTATATTGNILDVKYDFGLGSADNGNVNAITNNRDTTRSQNFTYDKLNRIATAETTSTYATSPAHCWGESYLFDNTSANGPWGNLTNINAASSAYNGCTQESLSVSAANNNQISGFCYDLAGNLLAQSAPPCPAPTYNYNAENQMTLTSGVTYTYDGDGKRVKKSNGTLYWYGMGSDALDETDLSGSLTNEYVFFTGQRIARRNASSTVFYYFEDHLGTSRVIVQSGQTSPCYDADFYPFGGERSAYTNTCPQNYKFTGKERDSESGLDNFGARYYGSTLGRFLSVDPVVITPERKLDPQQLSRYAYVRNNPLRLVDPTGEILQLSGDLAADRANLCQIAGDACDRISINEQTGVVSFNTEGLDLNANEGAAVINNLVQSQNTYDLSIGASVDTAGGKISVDDQRNLPPGSDQVANRDCKCAVPTESPRKGVTDQIAINPSAQFKDSEGRTVPLSSLIFHELAEAYSKIDGGRPYSDYQNLNAVKGTLIQIGPPEQGAHSQAVQRELKLREQRPNLQSTGRAGDQLIREPHN